MKFKRFNLYDRREVVLYTFDDYSKAVLYAKLTRCFKIVDNLTGGIVWTREEARS